MATKTYWLEPTEVVATGLRRYTSGSAEYTCEGGWHEALAWTGEAPAQFEDHPGTGRVLAPLDPVPADDPRWPTECAYGCGYQFVEGDESQAWQDQLYVRPETGERYTIHLATRDFFCPPGVLPAGPGASYDAWWYPEGWRGADGISLIVRCPRPDGSPGPFLDWCVDAPSTGSGDLWTRSGDPRKAEVTASPSIAIGDPAKPGYYHGFLQAGVLTDHTG